LEVKPGVHIAHFSIEVGVGSRRLRCGDQVAIEVKSCTI